MYCLTNRTCCAFLKVKAGKLTNLIGGEMCDVMDNVCLKLTASKSGQNIMA